MNNSNPKELLLCRRPQYSEEAKAACWNYDEI
jgi:hypothetical protein